MKTRRVVFLTSVSMLAVGWIAVWWFFVQPLPDTVIVDDGQRLVVQDAPHGTVCDVLAAAGINFALEDHLQPACDEDVAAGATITIDRKKTLTLHTSDGAQEIIAYGAVSLAQALAQADVSYDDNDLFSASLDDMVADGAEVTLTRVAYAQETVTETITFEKVRKDDLVQNKGYEKVTQKGRNGEKTIIYDIVLHDGEEFNRRVTSEEITTKPIDEITVIGTYEEPQDLKLGESHSGQASWYAHAGCLCAANPWLPFGAHVKVTNKANGKSVIVKITDRGPFVAGRIIDLDKVAWQKIAPLGAGVITVKMEEVKN